MAKLEIIITSVAKFADAKKLSLLLVKPKLAACATYFRANSAYYWDGKLVDLGEYIVEFKCDGKNAAQAKKLIEKHHPYSLPMIYSISPKWALPKYSKWVQKGKIL